ncbi:hypothetical protein D915_010736 [Fasciola hepatica]|uniref:Uncharacterized protein n=1 Tax=Fasciola hepatica TaxID=6192 RepID=A0A4E0QTI4_FASHE|nr:hypothetical protein D915_010736 [Fasciola hepatica]
MGRPRKRRSGQHHFGEFSSAESSGAFEGSFNSETKNPGGRKHARYAHEKTSHRMESGGRLTRSSRRSVSDARVTAHRISDEIQSGISPFAPDDSVLSQHPVDLDPLDDLKPSSPAQHNEIAESPIGRTMRRRRQTPDRLVHFNDDSNDSMGASRNAFPDTRATTQDRLSLRTQLSDSSASPNSNIIHRLRPRPPEAMLRYSVTRPYRSSHLSPRELKRERHKKRALKERILRRSSSTRHTMTRLRNAGSIADEEAASDEETHQDEDECAEDGERIKTDTRRYPVRNRRHTDVYQG